MICLILGFVLFLFAYGGGFWLAQKQFLTDDHQVFERVVYLTLAVSLIYLAFGIGLVCLPPKEKTDTVTNETSTSISSTTEPQVTTTK